MENERDHQTIIAPSKKEPIYFKNLSMQILLKG